MPNPNWKKGMKSPNPAGRPKGRTDNLLAAVNKTFEDEPGFWLHVAQSSKDGDTACTNLIASRLRPPLRPRSVPVTLDIQGDNAKDYTTGVLSAIAQGDLPPDEGSALLNAILAGDKLEKLEELEAKVDRLLEMQNGNP